LTVYVEVLLGETVMEAVVAPVFQLMVAPAGMPPAVLAVSVVELPAQIGEVPEMETGAKY
jgi:hypothetical protein